VHADDHQKTGKAGLALALAWLKTQTATTEAEVRTLLTSARDRIIAHIVANGAGNTRSLEFGEQVLAQLRELGEVDPRGALAAAPVLARLVARLADDDAWKPSASALLRTLAVAP
jgi:hypothetical protein